MMDIEVNFKSASDKIGEWFKDHKATKTEKDGITIIEWRKPGTYTYAIKYILEGNHIFISGDVGEAVYSLTCAATIDNIKDFDFYYFNSKLRAFCGEKVNFDPDLALKELREAINDHDLEEAYEHTEVIWELKEIIRDAVNVQAYQYKLYALAEHGELDFSDAEMLINIGQAMPYRLIGYWLGLKMIIKQLEEAGEKND